MPQAPGGPALDQRPTRQTAPLFGEAHTGPGAVRNEDVLATFNAMSPIFATGEGRVERVGCAGASIELDRSQTVRESTRLRPTTNLKGTK